MAESLHWWKYDDGAQYDLVERAGHLERQDATHGCSFTMSAEIEPLVRSLLARAAAAEAERDRLRDGLAEAIQAVEDWAAYADDYFKEKWNLAGDLERLRAFLTAAPPAAPPDEHPADELIAALEEARAWSRETFPAQTPASIAAHLSEEARELAERPESMEEMADVAMLFFALADARRVLTGDLAAAVRAKLVLCRERDWSDTSRGYLRAEKAVAAPPPLPAEVQRVVEAARIWERFRRDPGLSPAGVLREDSERDLEAAVAALRASRKEPSDG